MNRTIFHQSQRRSRPASRRSGAAFLILVVLVLLVIVGATKAFLMGELSARRGEASRLRARSLAAAMEATRGLLDASTTSLTLPVDQNQRIEVSVESASITARLMRDDQIVEEMVRPLDVQRDIKP